MRSIRKHEMIIFYDNNHNCSAVELLLVLSGHTCCCSVAVPLCELSQCEEVGGKFKKGRERSVNIQYHMLLVYLCYDKCHRHSHTKKVKRSKKQDHDIVVLSSSGCL